MTDLTNKIGRTGCEIRYDTSQRYGYNKAPHAMLQRAIHGPLSGTGYLNVGGKRREFGVICIPIPKPLYVIHPKDAGWVIKRIQALMDVKPAWARPTRKIPLDRNNGKLTRFTNIPDWVDWVDTRWVCFQCMPKESAGWNPKQCDPGCTISPSSKERQYAHNYDSRVMSPWAEDINAPWRGSGSECEHIKPGPRNPASPTICIPAIVPSTDGCRDHRAIQRMERYWTALWESVGDAITESNRRNPVRDDAEVAPSAPRAPSAPPVTENRRKSAWNTPLFLSLAAVGVAGVVIYSARRG